MTRKRVYEPKRVIRVEIVGLPRIGGRLGIYRFLDRVFHASSYRSLSGKTYDLYYVFDNINEMERLSYEEFEERIRVGVRDFRPILRFDDDVFHNSPPLPRPDIVDALELLKGVRERLEFLAERYGARPALHLTDGSIEWGVDVPAIPVVLRLKFTKRQGNLTIVKVDYGTLEESLRLAGLNDYDFEKTVTGGIDGRPRTFNHWIEPIDEVRIIAAEEGRAVGDGIKERFLGRRALIRTYYEVTVFSTDHEKVKLEEPGLYYLYHPYPRPDRGID